MDQLTLEEDESNNNDTQFQPAILNGQTAFTFYSFFLGFAIPLGLILVFYILVIFREHARYTFDKYKVEHLHKLCRIYFDMHQF